MNDEISNLLKFDSETVIRQALYLSLEKKVFLSSCLLQEQNIIRNITNIFFTYQQRGFLRFFFA